MHWHLQSPSRFELDLTVFHGRGTGLTSSVLVVCVNIYVGLLSVCKFISKGGVIAERSVV